MFIAQLGPLFPALRRSATYRRFAPPELGYGAWTVAINMSPLRGEERHRLVRDNLISASFGL
jgi:hypothetical protein